MVTTDEVSRSWAVPEEVRESFAELDLATPFPDWIRGIAWKEIERLRQERKEART